MPTVVTPTKKPSRLRIPLSATQEAFVKSDAPIVAIIGPEGEGKTYSGLAAAMYHADKRMKGQPLFGAVIRDTFENIKTKTRDSIDKAIRKISEVNHDPDFIYAWRWKDGGKLLLGPHGIRLDLFGANDPGDRTRLQGSDKWGFIWIEEPAPMFAHNNSGIPQYIFDDAISRAARGGPAMRVQLTMNPADEDHWTVDVLEKNPIQRPPETPDIWTKVFHIPYGENPARTDQMRQATKAAYRNDPGLFARLVKGEYAFVQVGESVTPEYNPSLHYQPHVDVPILPRVRGFRSWDGGHDPTCLIGQITPSGRLYFIDGLTLHGAGMKQLIETQVLPTINLYYSQVTEWLDTGDPTLETGDQGDSEQSPKRIIEKAFNTNFLPASHWPAVKEPMKAALNTLIDGKPYVTIGRRCEILHKALRGGWHYQKLASGDVIRDKPVKDRHSHPGDCFGAICLKMLGKQPEKPALESQGEIYIETGSRSGWSGLT